MIKLTRFVTVCMLATVAACVPSAAVVSPAAPPKIEARAPLQPVNEWLTDAGGHTDPRKVTTLIRVSPPQKLRRVFAEVARRVGDAELGDFFRTFAESGWSGSGFVMAHRESQQDDVVVVTNRHVVQQSEYANISLPDGSVFNDCEIVYTDSSNDLAVLVFPNGQRPLSFGLRPAAGGVQDLQTVVATGFPALGGKPMYQMTKGEVSNKAFVKEEDEDEGVSSTYIQHTAPIDPGSSGGPLTSPEGDLLGVNTLVAANRHSVFFAVPANAVVDAVQAALEIKHNRDSATWKKKTLVEACHVLTSEISSSKPKINVVDEFIANDLVAQYGLSSAAVLMSADRADRKFTRMFVADPMEAMRKALLLRMVSRMHDMGGLSRVSSCDINPNDEANITRTKTVRTDVETQQGRLEFSWTFEHGHWRVANADLSEL
jgi:serine protease Do